MELTSPDGDEGYPGEVKATAMYRLTDDNTLQMTITATSNAATPINIAGHSYFNLAGEVSEMKDMQTDRWRDRSIDR